MFVSQDTWEEGVSYLIDVNGSVSTLEIAIPERFIFWFHTTYREGKRVELFANAKGIRSLEKREQWIDLVHAKRTRFEQFVQSDFANRSTTIL